MHDIAWETAEALMENNIPVDDYVRIMRLSDNIGIEIEASDPVEAFREAIIGLNEAAELPSYLSGYCKKYDVAYQMPEVEPPPSDPIWI